ncbi:MAG TPA: Coagulation factor 5/8 type domain-containing protein [Kribbellaceae bacterium]|jgi:hypothetical protein
MPHRHVRRAVPLVVAALAAMLAPLTGGARPGPPAAYAASTEAEAQVDVDGFAFPGNDVGKPVRGFLQSHNHHWSYLGFGQGPFCGKTFDPDGVTAAMVDCPEHSPFGIPAWFEQLASGQPPLTPHDTTGWPTFRDWPSASSPTHNQTYYKGMERAWRAGVRMYVDHLVTNRGLCMIYTTTRTGCDEMSAIRTEARAAHAFEAYVDQQYGGPGRGWYRIVGSPAEARQVIADGKLAVVLGIETSEPFGCSRSLGVPQCTEADIDRGLDEVYGLGVRSMFLCHKYDNALCGVRFDSGTNGVVVNLGNFVTTGQFWQAETCTGPRHDNTITPEVPVTLAALLANSPAVTDPITLPLYPPAPHCNKLGLTALGEYTLEAMMRRGMIVDLDHMSVKAADQTLSVLEANDYSGVISEHDWMDQGYYPRVQRLGGMVTPIAEAQGHQLDVWRKARATADPRYLFGFGFALDQNGLHFGLPRPGESPVVTYPFTSYDGKATLGRQVWGQRVWDFNADGLAQEGLTPDWLESVRVQAAADSRQFVTDMTNGAEAYLEMWERTGA